MTDTQKSTVGKSKITIDLDMWQHNTVMLQSSLDNAKNLLLIHNNSSTDMLEKHKNEISKMYEREISNLINMLEYASGTCGVPF